MIDAPYLSSIKMVAVGDFHVSISNAWEMNDGFNLFHLMSSKEQIYTFSFWLAKLCIADIFISHETIRKTSCLIYIWMEYRLKSEKFCLILPHWLYLIPYFDYFQKEREDGTMIDKK